MYLASCVYEDIKDIGGKLVVDENKKIEKVLINVKTNDPDSLLREGNLEGVHCVSTQTNPSFCPDGFEGNVFREYYSIDELDDSVNNLPDGVVPLLFLDEGYSDMRELVRLTEKYPNLRVLGGFLLNVSGVNIGRYSLGKDKMSVVFRSQYDIFKETDLADLSYRVVKSRRIVTKKQEGGEQTLTQKRKIVKKEKKQTEKVKKESKKTRKGSKGTFDRLFGSEEVSF